MKPVCVPCQRFMRAKRNGFYFLEGKPYGAKVEWDDNPSAQRTDDARDAARYRWLRAEHRLSEVFVGDRGDALNFDNATPEEIDALIDEQIGVERMPILLTETGQNERLW